MTNSCGSRWYLGEIPEEIQLVRLQCGQIVAVIVIHSISQGLALGRWTCEDFNSVPEMVRSAMGIARETSFCTAFIGAKYGGAAIAVDKTVYAAHRANAVAAITAHLEKYENQIIPVIDEQCPPSLISRQLTSNANWKEHRTAQAKGILAAIKASSFEYFDVEISKLHVGISHLGPLGILLAQNLIREGANVVISDRDVQLLPNQAQVISCQNWSSVTARSIPIDVWVVTDPGFPADNIDLDQLGVAIVCSAFGQLAHASTQRCALAKKILYLPDYITVAWGMISLIGSINGKSEWEIEGECDRFKLKVNQLFAMARNDHRSLVAVADELVRETVRKYRRWVFDLPSAQSLQ